VAVVARIVDGFVYGIVSDEILENKEFRNSL